MSLRLPLATGLVLLVALASCSAPRPAPDDGPSPFVFRRLDLRQQDPSGRPAWELSSPEARYDLSRRVARAVRPKGLIYQDGKPLYRLQAGSGIVVNDGEVIQLEGGIRLQRLGPDPVVLRASRVRWLPSRQLIELDRHPEARDRHTRLRSDTARLWIERDRLELRGTPTLQQRLSATDPLSPLPQGRPQIEVKVISLNWGPRSGQLAARGPVQARRDGRASARSGQDEPPLDLEARSISGNTLQQRLSLEGPVRISQAPATVLQAGMVGLNLATSQASGEGGCRIQKSADTLSASRCGWNWRSQEISAQGEVLLRRGRPAQWTRASQLVGRLGDDGKVTLTAPGSRVVSQVRLPASRQSPRPQPRRSKPEPIRL